MALAVYAGGAVVVLVLTATLAPGTRPALTSVSVTVRPLTLCCTRGHGTHAAAYDRLRKRVFAVVWAVLQGGANKALWRHKKALLGADTAAPDVRGRVRCVENGRERGTDGR